MSEHYCTEHRTVWFKKGAMKGYAHPIEGTDPTQWCNEPTEETPKKETASSVKEPYKADPAKTVSIQNQVALKCAVEMCCGGVIDRGEIISWAKAFEGFLNGVLVVKDDIVIKEAFTHCNLKITKEP